MKFYRAFPRFLQTVVWIPARLALRFFTHLEIQNKKNLRGLKGPVIFASNHTSEMDVIMIPAALTPFSALFPIFYVARPKGKYHVSKGMKSKIYGGRFFQWWGAYPVVSGFKNYDTSLQLHRKILLNGRSLHIFPEGKLATDGVMAKEAHGGVAYLSWRTDTPIVPLKIDGTYESSADKFLKRKKFYSIRFGKPIYPKDIFKGKGEPTGEEFKKVANHVLKEIRSL